VAERLVDWSETLEFPYHCKNIYVYLVENGPIPRRKLTTLFKRNTPNFKENMEWLASRGYVYEEMDSKGVIQCFAFGPTVVSRAIFDEFLWTKMNYNRISEDDSPLSPQERESVAKYKKACDCFAKELETKYRNHATRSGVYYIKNGRQLSALLSELVSTANKSVFGIVVSRQEPSLPLLWESLKMKLEAGVEYRRISDVFTFISFGYAINKRDTEVTGVKLRLTSRKKITQKFYIVDGSRAIVFWGGLKGTDFEFEGTMVDNKAFLGKLKCEAEKIWTESLPSSVCLSYMSKLRGQFLQRTRELLKNQNEREFAEDLFDFGVFSKGRMVPSVSSQRMILRELLGNNLIVEAKTEFYPYGKTEYLPNIFRELSEFIDSKGSRQPFAEFSPNQNL
jgi:hypothetical protein